MKKGFLLVPFYMTEIIQASGDVELWKKEVSVFVERYEDDLTLFHNTDTELDIWHTYWSSKSPKSLPKKLSETLEIIHPLQTTFPTIYVLLQILATIPITTCTCERCISRLCFLKTYLRSTVTQERLTGLALLSIHHDRYIDLDDIVNRFARNNERKMTLLNILDTDDVTEQNKHFDCDDTFDI